MKSNEWTRKAHLCIDIMYKIYNHVESSLFLLSPRSFKTDLSAEGNSRQEPCMGSDGSPINVDQIQSKSGSNELCSLWPM